RFYAKRSPLILPPPVLYLEPEDEWRRHVEHSHQLRRGTLIFDRTIAGASYVTLWDATGKEVDQPYEFEREIDDVSDPGPGGTVELHDYRNNTFMVGIPVRVTRIEPAPVLHLESEEEWRDRLRPSPGPRTGTLYFPRYIANAALVTLRDSAGGEA